MPTLPEIGFRGLSTFGPRKRVHPVRGLRAVNTHVDLVDWKTRRFVGRATALAALVGKPEIMHSADKDRSQNYP